MAEEEIRVGLIGAGGNVRNRHIPGFRKVEGVQLMGVVNRSRESSHRIAEQFNIPRFLSTGRNCWKTIRSTPSASGPGPICIVRSPWRRWRRANMC